MDTWEESARETIRSWFDWIATKIYIDRFDVPVFIFTLIVLLLMQVIGWKFDKPILNIASAIIGIIFLMYFNII